MNRNETDYWLTELNFESIPCEEMVSKHLAETPFVSVLMLAWNHAEFIDEAIESVVTQKCEAPFELIIGEDCSTDETLTKCRAWQEKFPGIIRIFTSKENVGMHQNFARMWHRARGDFVAFCEGDDYWVDSLKLQKQINWFDKHPQGSLVGTFTDRIVSDKQGGWLINGRSAPLEIKNSYDLRDLLQNYSFHFSSVMIRISAVFYPRWFWDIYCVDRPLYLLAAENGIAGLLPTVTSRYRQHEGGIWSPRSELSKAESSTGLFRKLSQHLDEEYSDTCRSTLTSILWSYMSEAIDKNDWAGARQLYRQCMREDFWGQITTRPRALLVVFIRIHFPTAYIKLKGKPVTESAA